ncbi:serine protease, S1-C subfamily, contains C-terminal PDZ domain [Natronoarchaeum philippinense]|uniref:Serine protease, S1-C subfamily, contains C-terminal PDZ domain n=1 Tax=Natronoarchaeum philippinense TaxID=558529 RepID=A0A285P0R2_NATPI|nr:trypsin-like peptidase domain-containing protein [Natronoarchaeum philippinense]SNZ13471.1 serine protease, S1-C subfamily, contains C-terminal PDZ domain [Natronoarchaeum philippinense]
MGDTPLDRRAFLATGASAVVAALAGCNSQPSATTAAPQSQESPSNDSSPSDSPYTDVYEAVADSIVLIRAGSGQGTGFVYDQQHLITNAHVVGGASSVDVQYAGGSWAQGDVVGVDPHSDLAVVGVEDRPDDAAPLPLVQGQATVGQEVVVIGNPYSLDGTVTTGIVSGVNRSIPAPSGFRIPDAIQTDAAVNPGNSGGPLVSLDGEVLAVVNSGGGDNIAFGISAPLVHRVVPRLIESGEYNHPYLGASFTPVTPNIAAANELDRPDGIFVLTVTQGGPADGVLQGASDVTRVDGVRVPVGGDIVVGVDGNDIATPEDLRSYLALNTSPGETIRCRIRRNGAEQTVEIELGIRPERPTGVV